MMGVGLLCVSSIVAEESVEAPAPPVFPDLHTEGFEGGRRIDIHGVPLVGYAAPLLADCLDRAHAADLDDRLFVPGAIEVPAAGGMLHIAAGR